jgi:hypothetical protein
VVEAFDVSYMEADLHKKLLKVSTDSLSDHADLFLNRQSLTPSDLMNDLIALYGGFTCPVSGFVIDSF